MCGTSQMSLLLLCCAITAIFAQCGKTSPYVGASAPLVTLQHGVSGTIVVLDDCTFEVRNFKGDGNWPDGNWRIASDKNSLDSGDDIKTIPAGEPYTGITIQVPLPAGKKWGDDVQVISAWCTLFGISFATAELAPAGECPSTVKSISTVITNFVANDAHEVQVTLEIDCSAVTVTATIEATIPGVSAGNFWLGVGFVSTDEKETLSSPRMAGADLWTATILSNGDTSVIDRMGQASANGLPTNDADQTRLAVSSSSISGNRVSISITRAVEVEVGVDFAKPVHVLASLNAASGDMLQKHTYRTYVDETGAVNVFSGEQSSITIDLRPWHFFVHALFMCFAWLICAPIALMLRQWFPERKVFAILSELGIALCTLVGFIMAVTGVDSTGQAHFDRGLTLFSFHAFFGLFAFIFTVICCVRLLWTLVFCGIDKATIVPAQVGEQRSVLRLALFILFKGTFLLAMLNLSIGQWMYSIRDPAIAFTIYVLWSFLILFVTGQVIKRALPENVSLSLPWIVGITGGVISICVAFAAQLDVTPDYMAATGVPSFLALALYSFYLFLQYNTGTRKVRREERARAKEEAAADRTPSRSSSRHHSGKHHSGKGTMRSSRT